MEQNKRLLNSTNEYATFDDYLNSGQFAKLSPEEMTTVYNHYDKAGRIESEQKRSPLLHDSRRTLDDEPFEDLSILQPDGSRACANWELDENGFQLILDI